MQLLLSKPQYCVQQQQQVQRQGLSITLEVSSCPSWYFIPFGFFLVLEGNIILSLQGHPFALGCSLLTQCQEGQGGGGAGLGDEEGLHNMISQLAG